MGTLYIFGNGLDLHFRLKTSPRDFYEILKTKRIYNEISNAGDILESYGVFWSGYEESLAYIDLDEIEFQNIIMPDYLSDHESDRDGGILNIQLYLHSINEAIQSSLRNMSARANQKTKKRRAKGEMYLLPKIGDAVLSFNYTSTFENLFFIPQGVPVCHIHGFYERDEPLIFGYSTMNDDYKKRIQFGDEDGDYYVERQKEEINAFYENWQKPIQRKKLQSFLRTCGMIDRVCVYGHSMGQVDSEYMEQIEQTFHPLKWTISCFAHGDDVIRNVNNYSFSRKVEIVPSQQIEFILV